MKRRRVIVVGLACIVAVVVVVVVWPRDREPEYKGKRLSEWLVIYHSPDYDEKQVAEAVRHIGTNALPYLVKWLGYERSAWKSKLSATYEKWPQWLLNHSIRKWLLDVKRESLSQSAMGGFAIMGPDAGPAVPELTQLMQNTNSSKWAYAMVALTFIGKAGFPSLEAALTNRAGPNKLRFFAIYNLKYFETNSACLPALVGALEDPVYVVREAATNALLKIAPEVLGEAGRQSGVESPKREEHAKRQEN